jgi:hypothetical protein
VAHVPTPRLVTNHFTEEPLAFKQPVLEQGNSSRRLLTTLVDRMNRRDDVPIGGADSDEAEPELASA